MQYGAGNSRLGVGVGVGLRVGREARGVAGIWRWVGSLGIPPKAVEDPALQKVWVSAGCSVLRLFSINHGFRG
jgi:hypothetical protein